MIRPLAVAIALACVVSASPAAAEMRISVMEFTSQAFDDGRLADAAIKAGGSGR